MITGNEYKELLKNWSKHGHVYQDESNLRRLEHFEKYCCPHLKGKNVLELGCNAGLFGYVISRYASLYCGVEPGLLIKSSKHDNNDYYSQALVTLEKMPVDICVFINNTVEGFLNDNKIKEMNINALVCCFVLYHLSDEEIKLIETNVFPMIDVIVIQNRNKKRATERNRHRLEIPKNIIGWLERNGFKWQIENFCDTKYSEIIGKK